MVNYNLFLVNQLFSPPAYIVTAIRGTQSLGCCIQHPRNNGFLQPNLRRSLPLT